MCWVVFLGRKIQEESGWFERQGVCAGKVTTNIIFSQDLCWALAKTKVLAPNSVVDFPH